MDNEEYIGCWGSCNLGKASLKDEDADLLDNYPFKDQWHKCIGIEGQFLKIKFCCLTLRMLPFAFVVTEPPDFMPFEEVKYISSKGQLEFGVVVGFGVLVKPKLRRVYLLEVHGKRKTTLYEADQLMPSKNTPYDSFYQELKAMILQILTDQNRIRDLKFDENGWANIEDLIISLSTHDSKWKSLRYHNILKLVDQNESQVFEVRPERIGLEYKNRYNWFIRTRFK